jgi:hypothetical protein
MEITEATRAMELLEQRYFVLNRDVRTTKVPPGGNGAAEVRARLAESQNEMRAILQQIAQVEDSLLD